MKFQKLFVSAVIVCFLVGTSGAAMAVENCLSGVILGQFVDDNVKTNQDCVIKDSIITGRVTVDFKEPGGAGRLGVLVMDGNIIRGRVKVVGGGSVIIRNIIVSSNLRVEDAEQNTVVQDNLIKGPGSIIVSDSIIEGADLVIIESNTVPEGNIRCKGNTDPSDGAVGAVAQRNIVPNGNITCYGQ